MGDGGIEVSGPAADGSEAWSEKYTAGGGLGWVRMEGRERKLLYLEVYP